MFRSLQLISVSLLVTVLFAGQMALGQNPQEAEPAGPAESFDLVGVIAQENKANGSRNNGSGNNVAIIRERSSGKSLVVQEKETIGENGLTVQRIEVDRVVVDGGGGPDEITRSSFPAPPPDRSPGAPAPEIDGQGNANGEDAFSPDLGAADRWMGSGDMPFDYDLDSREADGWRDEPSDMGASSPSQRWIPAPQDPYPFDPLLPGMQPLPEPPNFNEPAGGESRFYDDEERRLGPAFPPSVTPPEQADPLDELPPFGGTISDGDFREDGFQEESAPALSETSEAPPWEEGDDRAAASSDAD